MDAELRTFSATGRHPAERANLDRMEAAAGDASVNVHPAQRPARIARGKRAYLAIEYAVLFFGAVAAYTLLDRPGSPIPVLVVLAAAATVYLLRQPGFDRASFGRLSALRPQLGRILLLWAAISVGIVAVLAIWAPERLFSLPRENPVLWLIIIVAYPLVSVYPQELIFRGFLLHRYRPVFGTGWPAIAASAAAFGFVHVIYGNVISVAMTLVGGAIFTYRYQRTRSLLVASVEHALYGLLIFTVGLGEFFYNGGG